VHLTVYSERGGGTMSRFLLPTCYISLEPEVEQVHAKDCSMHDETAVHTAGSVLVVDDDHPTRLMLTRILERAGFVCTQAADASTALGFAEMQEFSLVTCDVKMPGGSGLELVRDLKERYPDIAVLMISGMDDPATAAVAGDLGAYGYVVKPFEVNEILIAAANAVRRRELEVENRAHRRHLEQLVSDRTADLTSSIERLSQAELALRESQEEVIRRLAFAAEFRDPTTGAHIDRMSRTCELLALKAGMDLETAELIRIASPMHDIGKIGVRDDVLRKPGKLTEDEMDEMRKHPFIGGEILAGSDSALLRLGGQIALTHHERWDGSGYPNGLARDAIPFEGRIVAIADVFDALTSERSYKPAFEVDHAVAIMTDESGSHFDPDLLDLFLAMVDEVVGLAHATP
jgi:putative two-component system response regulator